MVINRSTGYAILAVGYVARNQKDGEVLCQKISKQYDISLTYLLKIMQSLVKNNILRSKRGPRGGFTLAKPPEKINMLEIVEAVEGPMLNKLDLAEYVKSNSLASNADKAYDTAIEKVKEVLKNTKLSTLLKGSK